MGKTSQCASRHAEIVGLLAQRLSIPRVAQQLGLSVRALQAYLARREIRQTRSTPRKVDEARLTELLQIGRTHQQIAAELGVSTTAIERRVARLGLQTARTGPRSGSSRPGAGRTLAKHGYVDVYAPLHPQAKSPTGRVPEHRLLMEVCLGRYLLPTEVVHHEDDHPRHNWPLNLGLHASNADHLRTELSGREKATPRRSIPGAYGSNQTLSRCPDEHETLAQCPSEIRQRLAWYIESHRPTSEHRMLARREFLRLGAWRDPFQWPSKG